jgi:pyruvate/2-oxoglutarate dehydrogenase complex dihydrolipoamide acyltransferase (E2) component
VTDVPRHRFIALLAALALAAAVAPAAVADGDPASDYLITQPAFFPFDAHIGTATSDELVALLAASKKAGFEIRVAVISTQYDLGAVPVLYGKPVQYAHFLGQELFYWYKRELLVVMPAGYGVYHHGTAPAADRAAVAALAPPATTAGNALVAAASRAVRALAARRGIDLSHVTAAGSRSSTGSDRIAIAIGAAVSLALAAGLVLLRRRRAAQR